MVTFVEIFRDNFTRPNESPLNPANWSPAGDFPNDTLQVFNDSCQIVVDADFFGLMFYTGTPIPDDQYVEATIGSLGFEISVYGRSTGSSTEGYEAAILQDPGPTYDLALILHHAGSATFLGTIVGIPAPHVGDIIRLEMNGSTISLLHNGVVKISVTDATLASGRTGLTVEVSAVQSDTTVTSFGTGAINQTNIVLSPNAPPSAGGFYNVAGEFPNDPLKTLMLFINYPWFFPGGVNRLKLPSDPVVPPIGG